jgi:hypothetical protein
MNSTHLPRNWIAFTPRFRKHRQRRRLRHDRWLVFNMAAFNWEENWNGVFHPLRDSTRRRA